VTAEKLFTGIYNGGLVVFLLTLIASLGMTFSVAQIVAPLRRVRVLLGVIVVNLGLAPLVAIGIGHLLPLHSQTREGLVIVTIAAGAPIAMKACQLAKRADIAMAVSFTIVLILLSIPVVSLWAQAIISGAKVDAWAIVKDLVFLVLVPLVVGLFLRSRYPEYRENWKDGLEKISNIALYLALVVGIAVNWNALISVIGSWVILASVLIIIAYAVLGAVVGLPEAPIAVTTSLMTAFKFTPVGLVVIATVLHNQSAYLTPALVFVLVDTILPLALGVEIGHRVQQASAREAPAGQKTAPVKATVTPTVTADATRLHRV
jgi:BASS family bile acid:Na+ symporter